MTFGAPQGLILGPLAFIFIINEIPKAAEYVEVHMYADDTAAF